MPLVTIEDRDTVHEINGHVIGASTTSDVKPRWMTITLYRLASGKLLLHRAGLSRLYHDTSERCKTSAGRPSGDLVRAGDLPDDIEACEVCNPLWPDDLPDDTMVRFEFPRHTLDYADTAEEITKMLEPRQAGRDMSDPSKSVFEQARRNDPEFAALPKRRVRM